MTDIIWQDPPEPSKDPRKFDPFRDTLRANPHTWALLPDGPRKSPTTANSIRNGASPWAPAGTWEAAARKREDSLWDIYARFVGEDK